MKVCVVGLRGMPDVMGGVETHCEQLLPRLKQRRPDDSFTVIGRKAYLREQAFTYRGLQIVSLGHARGRHFETISNTIYGVLYARFVVHADLLHLHGIGPALTAPLARLLGMKTVITCHSKNYEHRKWNWLARSALRIGELFAARFGDRVITVSQLLAADLKRRFPRSAHKIHYIPNGADHLKTACEIDSARDLLGRYGLAAQRYVVSVGRLVPEKGFHDLLMAFRGANLDGKLVIVGAADHRDDYATRLLAQSSGTVVFTGFLPHDSLQVILSHASLFVLPSYNEGLPIAALEAAVTQTPILLSDIEPHLDLRLSPRNYFRVGNIGDLRHKLEQDHTTYRVDAGALLQRFNWQLACTETDKLYSSLQKELAARA